MKSWGFRYVSNIIWAKRRIDGGPDGRGVGFYFRNVTEILLFGVRGSMRTLAPGRSQVNMIETRKREHSRKPDEQYELINRCSPGPYLELFARHPQPNWTVWGDESDEELVAARCIRGMQAAQFFQNCAIMSILRKGPL
jgi:N6-adenosine-specific RNA methylase IME4